MRIACIYLPSFPLQVHVRHAPHLVGQSVAITSAGERPNVVACSRHAWGQGVRPGMSAISARALAPELLIVPGNNELCQDAARSLGESLLSASVTVDIGEHESSLEKNKSIYLHVPTGSRGSSFGAKLIALIEEQGFRGRVGVADDRFTAWVAAAIPPVNTRPKEIKQLALAALPAENPNFIQATTVVQRGGAAAFLAPQPLELLPLEDEVRQMLHTLGIHTLGDFAALPPPSVGRRWHRGGVDYQALARGDGPTLLTGLTPSESIVEAITCSDELTDLEPLSFLLRPLIDRACHRLRGRGMAAGELTLTLSNPESSSASEHYSIKIAPSRATLASQTLLDLLRAKLSELSLQHSVTTLHLGVTRESEPEVCELDLFDHRDAEVSGDAVDVAIARLQASLGEDSVNAAKLVDNHRPERAFKLTPFSPPRKPKKTRRAKAKAHANKAPKRPRRKRNTHPELLLPMILTGMFGALRLFDPPRPLTTGLNAIEHNGSRHRVVASHGPTRLQTEWWEQDGVDRDYYEVETDDGGRYWVYRTKSNGRYYLHGIFD